MNCVEKKVKAGIEKAFPGRVMTIGRAAVRRAPTAPIVGGVHDHAIEPGREAGLTLEPPQLCRQGGANVLCEVFGFVLPPGEPEGEAEDTVIVAFDKRCEGRPVAAGCRHCEVEITTSHAHHSL